MKNRRLLAVTLLSFSTVMFVGCDNSDDSQRKSRRGETCSFTNDCKNTLACVNGVCIQDDFPVAVEAKECVLIECRNEDDCCGDNFVPSSDCDYYAGLCENAQNACETRLASCTSVIESCRGNSGDLCGTALQECSDGSMTGCAYVESECSFTCREGITTCQDANACSSTSECDQAEDVCACNLQCSDNRCIEAREACGVPADCGENLVCDDGECVECADDDGCRNGLVCEEGSCIAACRVVSDCPLFSECNGGHCEHVGCTSNRECVLFTGSGAAVCLNAQCIEPCQANSQCGPLQACVNAECTFLGCENDSDCLALHRGRYGEGSSLSGDLVCSDADEITDGTTVISPMP